MNDDDRLASSAGGKTNAADGAADVRWRVGSKVPTAHPEATEPSKSGSANGKGRFSLTSQKQGGERYDGSLVPMEIPMTKIGKRVIVRETACVVAGEPLVVTLLPKTLHVRRKGKVTGGVSVTYEQIYQLGETLAARHVRAKP